jgi:hypothetical protein
MNATTDFERMVSSWLEDDGPSQLRSSVVDEALTRARGRSQRRRIRGWAVGVASWPTRGATRRPMGAFRLAVVILLLALLAAGAVFVGRELLRDDDAIPRELLGRLNTSATLTGVRSGRSVVALPEGRVLVAGEVEDGSIAEIVDLATGSTVSIPGSEIPFMPTGAAVLPDGGILLTGVSRDQGVARVVEPANGRVVSQAAMTAARYEPAITRLADGRVLVSGGSTSTHTPESLASAEVYDPATGAFAPTGPMAVAREGHAMTTLRDGRVLVSGGSTTAPRSLSGGSQAEQVSSQALDVELFDPARGVFERVNLLDRVTPRMGRGSESVAPVRLPDDRVLIFRGQDGQYCGRHGTDPIATAIFDPTSGTLSAGHPIPHNITTATALPDGRVLVTGVWTFGTCQEGSEYIQDAWIGIHDPITGVTLESRDPRTGAASLAVDTDRGYLVSVPLPDGRVALVSDGGLYGINGGDLEPQVVDVFE